MSKKLIPVVVLGALSDEVIMIKRMLAKANIRVVVAATEKGAVKYKSQNHKATELVFSGGLTGCEEDYYWIHAGCTVKGAKQNLAISAIHHENEQIQAMHCWEYSLLGQIVKELDVRMDGEFSCLVRSMMYEARIAVASEYCLDEAYAGRVPGVNPIALRFWRAMQRARIQKKDANEVLATIEYEAEKLAGLPSIAICDELEVVVAEEQFKEIVDAAALLGMPVQYKVGKDKVKLINANSREIAAWMDWVKNTKSGLKEPYGSKEKRYAGAIAA